MSEIVHINTLRLARGLAPVDPETAFGPPIGKRIGDKVCWTENGETRNGLVNNWRPNPGHSATLFITAGSMSCARDADDVVPVI